jgi:flagellar basal-body rod modification protein FlgD
MQTTDVSSLAATVPTAGAVKSSSDLGRDEFLRMLIAQLENQDPLDPQDATEFTAQLAQFTSLDQLVSMRTSIEALTRAQGASQSLSAATLIGRRVLVESETFSLAAGQPAVPFVLEAAEATALNGAEVVDGAGRVVARSGALTLDAGRNTLDWSRFDRVPGPGTYTLRLAPVAGGSAPRVLVEGEVTGASFLNGSAMLMLGTTELPLTALREVRS